MRPFGRGSCAFRHCAAAAIAAGALCVSAAAQPVEKNRLVSLDGRESFGSVVRIDTAGKVYLAGKTEPVPLNGLRLLQNVMRTQATDPATGNTLLVRLSGDGLIRAKSVAVKSEKVHVTWSGGPELKLPLEAVRSVQFQAATNALFVKAGANPSADNDQLIVEIRGRFRTVPALIESLDETQVVFTSDKRKVTLPRQGLYGIVFAFVKKPAKQDRSTLCRVQLLDGSVLPGRIVELPRVPGKLRLKLVEGDELSIDWDRVTQVSVVSSRLHWLSDLKPADVAEQTIVALPQKWRADMSVSGTPLRLAGRTFEKGIGVHSRSQLTFELDGKYETFAAVIGLDDAARRKGDCVFVISADGREVLRQRVRGRDKPMPVRVNVRNARRLVLLVEPGENLDIADHADWCDACLILPAKS